MLMIVFCYVDGSLWLYMLMVVFGYVVVLSYIVKLSFFCVLFSTLKAYIVL
jgi:hypothetical protein